MAITHGVTGISQSTAGTTEETAYTSAADGGKFTTMMIRCTSGSAGTAIVRVTPMHAGVAAGSGVPIIAGDREYFRVGSGQIEGVYVGAASDTATVDWGPVADTR